jgi:hypothetical protein
VTGMGSLFLSGYVRARPLSANQLVHITGIGSFKVDSILLANDPCPLKPNPRGARQVAAHDGKEAVPGGGGGGGGSRSGGGVVEGTGASSSAGLESHLTKVGGESRGGGMCNGGGLVKVGYGDVGQVLKVGKVLSVRDELVAHPLDSQPDDEQESGEEEETEGEEEEWEGEAGADACDHPRDRMQHGGEGGGRGRGRGRGRYEDDDAMHETEEEEEEEAEESMVEGDKGGQQMEGDEEERGEEEKWEDDVGHSFKQRHLGLGSQDAVGTGGGCKREGEGVGYGSFGVGVPEGYRPGVRLDELVGERSGVSSARYNAEVWDGMVVRGRRDEAMAALSQRRRRRKQGQALANSNARDSNESEEHGDDDDAECTAASVDLLGAAGDMLRLEAAKQGGGGREGGEGGAGGDARGGGIQGGKRRECRE